MKKKYIKPRVKVVSVRTVNMLCLSGDSVKFYKEEVDEEETKKKYGTGYFDGGW
ncbi:MAG: hypothetical protein KBT27_10710 [Prevotellaceae bacterium]|nr:hypothetical protein [Candidatus Faecinaster equi]